MTTGLALAIPDTEFGAAAYEVYVSVAGKRPTRWREYFALVKQSVDTVALKGYDLSEPQSADASALEVEFGLVPAVDNDFLIDEMMPAMPNSSRPVIFTFTVRSRGEPTFYDAMPLEEEF